MRKVSYDAKRLRRMDTKRTVIDLLILGYPLDRVCKMIGFCVDDLDMFFDHKDVMSDLIREVIKRLDIEFEENEFNVVNESTMTCMKTIHGICIYFNIAFDDSRRVMATLVRDDDYEARPSSPLSKLGSLVSLELHSIIRDIVEKSSTYFDYYGDAQELEDLRPIAVEIHKGMIARELEHYGILLDRDAGDVLVFTGGGLPDDVYYTIGTGSRLAQGLFQLFWKMDDIISVGNPPETDKAGVEMKARVKTIDNVAKTIEMFSPIFE